MLRSAVAGAAKTHAAPALLLSLSPPTMAVVLSAERDTEAGTENVSWLVVGPTIEQDAQASVVEPVWQCQRSVGISTPEAFSRSNTAQAALSGQE